MSLKLVCMIDMMEEIGRTAVCHDGRKGEQEHKWLSVQA